MAAAARCRANTCLHHPHHPPSHPNADHYHLLAPIPVDLVAGRHDGIIGAQDVYLHYLHMKEVWLRDGRVGACRAF